MSLGQDRPKTAREGAEVIARLVLLQSGSTTVTELRAYRVL